MLQLGMSPKYLKFIIHSNYSTSSLLALEKLSTSYQNGPVTGTIIIKPEHLATLLCRARLTLSMDITEAKTIIFLHLLQYNFTQGHLFVLSDSSGLDIYANLYNHARAKCLSTLVCEGVNCESH